MYTANIDPEVAEWIKMLQSPELNDRLVAVKTLQHLGDEGAIEGLIMALEDESPAVQKIAVTTLWELANPAAIPALIKCRPTKRSEKKPSRH